jgi:hypothetical protein
VGRKEIENINNKYWTVLLGLVSHPRSSVEGKRKTTLSKEKFITYTILDLTHKHNKSS